jgi:hypothetical protein
LHDIVDGDALRRVMPLIGEQLIDLWARSGAQRTRFWTEVLPPNWQTVE